MMILDMYVTMLPVIAAGILNMVFTKTALYRRHKTPIDHFRCLSDGRRLFGDNKTWIGFFSMIIFCTTAQLVWGYFLGIAGLEGHSELYLKYPDSPVYNLLTGFLFGLAYMLLELPNSFVKRRLDIQPGRTKDSGVGAVFFVIDQIDSLLGVMAVLYCFSHISVFRYFGYIALGGITHIVVNLILYKIKIRRNL